MIAESREREREMESARGKREEEKKKEQALFVRYASGIDATTNTTITWRSRIQHILAARFMR